MLGLGFTSLISGQIEHMVLNLFLNGIFPRLAKVRLTLAKTVNFTPLVTQTLSEDMLSRQCVCATVDTVAIWILDHVGSETECRSVHLACVDSLTLHRIKHVSPLLVLNIIGTSTLMQVCDRLACKAKSRAFCTWKMSPAAKL